MAEIPNLDAMDEEELLVAQEGFWRLYQYVIHKRWAIMSRKRGEVDKALVYEKDADSIYRLTPEEYRW
jgi:hypothetical protein